MFMGMRYYCVDCQQESDDLSDLTGDSHENQKADYLSGEECADCGGQIEGMPK